MEVVEGLSFMSSPLCWEISGLSIGNGVSFNESIFGGKGVEKFLKFSLPQVEGLRSCLILLSLILPTGFSNLASSELDLFRCFGNTSLSSSFGKVAGTFSDFIGEGLINP